MCRRLVMLGVLVILAIVAASRDAAAFRLRLGGYSVVQPETDTKFSIGLDNDMKFLPILGLNYGALYSVDGDGMFTDVYLGLKFFYPVAMDGKLQVSLRGNFIMKWFYNFNDRVTEDNALALGGVVGPGLVFDLGPASLSFEMDVQIYSFVYPKFYERLDTQVALVYLFGVGF
jgi:hypothetical protein